MFPGDDARYVNHFDYPNISDVSFAGGKNSSGEEIGIAARDIKKGQEITSKYLVFDKKGNAKHL